MKMLRDPLFWLIALFVALIFWLPYSQPLFAALFPQLPRPVYQQESFAALALAHFWLVGISSLFAVIIGTGAGIAVTRPWGAEFRPLVETICRRWTDFSACRSAGDCRSGDRLWSATSDYRLDPLRCAARPAGDTCRAGSD